MVDAGVGVGLDIEGGSPHPTRWSAGIAQAAIWNLFSLVVLFRLRDETCCLVFAGVMDARSEHD